MMIRVPAHWQAEIDAGTEFGLRAQAAIEAATLKTTAGPQRKSCSSANRKISPQEPVGTALKSRIENLLSVKTGEGCGCQNLVVQMDGWGIAGCELRRGEIITHLVNNREVLTASLSDRSWLAGVAAGLAPDLVLRTGADWLLTQAINDVRAMPKPPRPVGRPQPGRRPYAGWRSESDGPRIKFGPFVSSIRHLTYHVYAAKTHDSWKWNLEQLAKRWQLFNGTRIIGISEGTEAQSASQVITFAESLGIVFDHHVIRPNNEKLREVVTWIPMLDLLNPQSAGANEVVFSAHAKGQKYDDPSHTRDWTDLMYQSCLDDWPAVYNALRTSLMAGSMREYGLLGKWNNWAYSGTFYWWRLAEIGKRKWRDVDQWFAGTESWPGKMCDARETECLFLNDSRRMYDHQYWVDVVWPEWNRYLQHRK